MLSSNQCVGHKDSKEEVKVQRVWVKKGSGTCVKKNFNITTPLWSKKLGYEQEVNDKGVAQKQVGPETENQFVVVHIPHKHTHTHTQDLNTHTSLNRSCKLWRSESRSECLQSTNVPVWKPVSHLHLCPTYSNSGLWATCVTCGPVTTSESSARSFEKLRDSELACNFGTRSDHECNTRLRSSNMKTTVHHCGVWMCSKEGRIMNGLYGLTNTCLFQYFSLQPFTVSCCFIHSYGSVQIL